MAVTGETIYLDTQQDLYKVIAFIDSEYPAAIFSYDRFYSLTGPKYVISVEFHDEGQDNFLIKLAFGSIMNHYIEYAKQHEK